MNGYMHTMGASSRQMTGEQQAGGGRSTTGARGPQSPAGVRRSPRLRLWAGGGRRLLRWQAMFAYGGTVRGSWAFVTLIILGGTACNTAAAIELVESSDFEVGSWNGQNQLSMTPGIREPGIRRRLMPGSLCPMRDTGHKGRGVMPCVKRTPSKLPRPRLQPQCQSGVKKEKTSRDRTPFILCS